MANRLRLRQLIWQQSVGNASDLKLVNRARPPQRLHPLVPLTSLGEPDAFARVLSAEAELRAARHDPRRSGGREGRQVHRGAGPRARRRARCAALEVEQSGYALIHDAVVNAAVEKERWRRYGPELRLILWAAWDPIDVGVPPDEYDTYAPQVWELLRSGASEDDVAAHLRTFVSAPSFLRRSLRCADRSHGWRRSPCHTGGKPAPRLATSTAGKTTQPCGFPLPA